MQSRPIATITLRSASLALAAALATSGCQLLLGYGESSADAGAGGNAAGAGGTGAGGSGGGGGAPTCVEGAKCYTGPPATEGVGRCSPGISCGDGECIGEVTPAVEDCATTDVDDDCDGATLCTGAALWASSIAGTGRITALSVAFAPNGDVAVAGKFSGKLDGDHVSKGQSDALVALFDGATGARKWLLAFGSQGEDQAGGVAFDSKGRLNVVGFVGGEAEVDANHTLSGDNDGDGFLLRLSPAGVVIDKAQFTGAGYQQPVRVAIDDQDSVYIGGWFRGELMPHLGPTLFGSLFAGFIVKYTAQAGNSLAYGGGVAIGGKGIGLLNDFAVAREGGRYTIAVVGTCGGYFALGDEEEECSGALGEYDAYVAVLDGEFLTGAAKMPRWLKKLAGTKQQIPNAVAFAPDGRVAAAGHTGGELTLDDEKVLGDLGGFIATFAQAGDLVSVHSYGYAGPKALEFDAIGQLVSTGQVIGFWTPPGQVNPVSSNSVDIFAHKLRLPETKGGSPTHVWLQTSGGSGVELHQYEDWIAIPHPLAMALDGSVAITGSFSAEMKLQGYELKNTSQQNTDPPDDYDIFVAKLRP